MKLIGFVVALLGILEPTAAANEKGLKKKINEKIGNLKSFYWRPNEDEPKVLCGMCRDKTDQDMNAKCNYKTGTCPDIPNGQRCMKGKYFCFPLKSGLRVRSQLASVSVPVHVLGVIARTNIGSCRPRPQHATRPVRPQTSFKEVL